MNEMEKHMLHVFELLLDNEEFLHKAISKIKEQYELIGVTYDTSDITDYLDPVDEDKLEVYCREVLRWDIEKEV